MKLTLQEAMEIAGNDVIWSAFCEKRGVEPLVVSKGDKDTVIELTVEELNELL